MPPTKSDHDILIEIQQDIHYLKEFMDRFEDNLNNCKTQIDEHDRWIQRFKGAVAAIVIFFSVFGVIIFYLVDK